MIICRFPSGARLPASVLRGMNDLHVLTGTVVNEAGGKFDVHNYYIDELVVVFVWYSIMDSGSLCSRAYRGDACVSFEWVVYSGRTVSRDLPLLTGGSREHECAPHSHRLSAAVKQARKKRSAQ